MVRRHGARPPRATADPRLIPPRHRAPRLHALLRPRPAREEAFDPLNPNTNTKRLWGSFRLVGRVLQNIDPATDIPWHRVVNAKGAVSYTLSRNGSDAFQQRLLEKEGVEFDDRNRFNLERFRWPE